STINDRVQQYLTKYKKLKIIEVPEKSEFAFNSNSYKISAFICVKKKTICQFISDKYNVICPFNCHCGLDRSEMRFDISCQYYNTIRELPIPIIGNTSLNLNNNRLTILPSNTESDESRKLYQIKIFKECVVPYTHSIQLTTTEPITKDVEIHLSLFYNLNHLKWIMLDKCHSPNELISNFKQLRSLSLTVQPHIFFCKELHTIEHDQLNELYMYIDTLKTYIGDHSDELYLHKTFLSGMQNLKVFHIENQCETRFMYLSIDPQIFRELTHLEKVVLKSRAMLILEKELFRNLTNLKDLHLLTLSTEFEWISSETLQNNLEYLDIFTPRFASERFGVEEALASYKKLKIVNVNEDGENSFGSNKYNMSAFVCTTNERTCKFITDKYKRPCPTTCRCTLDRTDMRFDIDCSSSTLHKAIPELPIPMTGNTSLIFDNSNLTTLPTSDLYGYSEVRELHLNNNQLSTISVDQLPINITYLDLRNNRLEGLNEQVLEFLSNRSSILSVKLSGNPWICKCEAQSLIRFVVKYSKIEDQALQNNLEHLKVVLSSNSTTNNRIQQYLANYKKLEIIEIPEGYEFAFNSNSYKISAFLCIQNYKTCQFISDKSKMSCPVFCHCTLDRSEMRFDISSQYYNTIRELPIPIIGHTSLKLNNNKLTILPSNTVYGYSEVRELHLANNKLSNLTVDQLPKNLTYLDLRNNRLEKLDQQVLEFLWNRTSSLNIKLSGNPWICKCETQNLIHFALQYPKIIDRDNKYKRPCPKSCRCTLDRSDVHRMRFDIDCSSSTLHKAIPELPIPMTGNTSLIFDNSNLKTLPTRDLYGYSEVKELHLNNNQLSTISVDQLPINITYLDLRNNRLEGLNKQVLEFLWNRSSSLSIKLSGNPWICKCAAQSLIQFVVKNTKIEDRRNINCSDPNIGQMINFKLDQCGTSMNYSHLIIIIIGVNTVLIIILFVYFRYKPLILLWLYENGYCLRWISRPEPDEGIVMKNDAFIAFCNKDLERAEEFVEALENGAKKYKVCYYHRDWLPGQLIPACILTSIEESRRTIILMTEHFISSSWGRFEFRSAIKANSENKKKRLIVILYPNVDTENLDTELKSYLKYNTYLSREDPHFWRKLMFAMPHNHTPRIVLADPETRL
ncbi:hypothetical protein KR044_011645, partial [Drosophila immigrans]